MAAHIIVGPPRAAGAVTLEIGVVQDGVWLDDPFVLRFLPADPRGAGCAAGTNAGGV